MAGQASPAEQLTGLPPLMLAYGQYRDPAEGMVHGCVPRPAAEYLREGRRGCDDFAATLMHVVSEGTGGWMSVRELDEALRVQDQ